MIDRRFEDNIGGYYRDENGNLVQLLAYCDQPSATFKKVGVPNSEIHIGAYSPIAEKLTPLTKAECDAINAYKKQMRRP